MEGLLLGCVLPRHKYTGQSVLSDENADLCTHFFLQECILVSTNHSHPIVTAFIFACCPLGQLSPGKGICAIVKQACQETKGVNIDSFTG